MHVCMYVCMYSSSIYPLFHARTLQEPSDAAGYLASLPTAILTLLSAMTQQALEAHALIARLRTDAMVNRLQTAVGYVNIINWMR